MESAELDLEVDKVNADVLEEAKHELIYLESILCDILDLFLSSKTKTKSIILVDEWVAKLVALVAELKCRLLELCAFLDTELL